jgi:hypothetical protein
LIVLKDRARSQRGQNSKKESGEREKYRLYGENKKKVAEIYRNDKEKNSQDVNKWDDKKSRQENSAERELLSTD